jgi:hypothetical protein
MAIKRMKKAEMFERVADAVRGKQYSNTDVRVTYVGCIEHASRNGELTPHQRQEWYATKRELEKLYKITKECHKC